MPKWGLPSNLIDGVSHAETIRIPGLPRSQSIKTLLVLGATGQMGRRIIALARRLLLDVRVLQGARRVAMETDPDLRRVDIHDTDSMRRALAGVQVAINAVRPFEYDPTPLLQGCAEAACHYVDIAEA